MLGLLLACAVEQASPAPAPVDTGCGDDEVDDGGTCVPAACGTAPWGGKTGDWYVAEGGSGDGSADAPFGTIEEAVGRGGRIVVGAGVWTVSWDEPEEGVDLVGRCRERVTIDGGGVAEHLFRSTQRLRSSVADVRVSGFSGPAFWVEKGSLALERVDVVGGGGAVVAAYASAAVTAEDLRTSGLEGHGVESYYGAEVTCGRCVLDGATEAAVFAVAGAVTLDASSISQVAAGPQGNAIGIQASDGGVVLATDLVVSEIDGLGIGVVGEGSTISVTRGEIGPVRATRVGGGSAATSDGGILVLDGVWLHDLAAAGVSVFGGELTIRDSSVERVVAGSRSEDLGYGLYAGLGAQVNVAGSTVRDVLFSGVTSSDVGTGVTLQDVVIGAVGEGGGTGQGVGLVVQEGAAAVLDSVELLDLVDVGAVVFPDATLTAEGVSVGPVAPNHDGEGGTGLYVEGHADLVDVSITDVGRAGLQVAGGEVDARGLEVRGVRVDAGGDGVGVQVDSGGALSLVASRVSDTASRSLVAANPGTSLTLEDVELSDVEPDGRVPYASLLEVQDGASAAAVGLTATGGQGASVYVGDATLSLVGSTVAGARHLDGVGVGGAITVRGGQVDLAEVTVEDVEDVGLLVTGDGALATGEGVLVRDVRRSVALPVAAGILAQSGGGIHLTRATVEDVQGPGVAAGTDGLVQVEDAAITRTTFAGVVVSGGAFEALGSWSTTSRPIPASAGGWACGPRTRTARRGCSSSEAGSTPRPTRPSGWWGAATTPWRRWTSAAGRGWTSRAGRSTETRCTS